MFSKRLDTSKIRKILIISLSNIGDVILTCPVVDKVKETFPRAKLSLVIGTKAKSLFDDNPYLEKVYIFNKQDSLGKIVQWIGHLRKEQFDCVIDLRHTAIPFFINPQYRTSFWRRRKPIEHKKDIHLQRLDTLGFSFLFATQRYALFTVEEDQKIIEDYLQRHHLKRQQFIVIAPGAADQKKRWPEQYFAQVADHLINQYQIVIVFVGDEQDAGIVQRIQKLMDQKTMDTCGSLSLLQLAALLQKSLLAIVNDSAPLHLASYFDIPVLGLFGPTDPSLYGPWGRHHKTLKASDGCMQAIKVEDVLASINIKNNKVLFV